MAATYFKLCLCIVLMVVTFKPSRSAIDDILIEPDLKDDILVGKAFDDLYEVKIGDTTYTRVELDILIEEERRAQIYQTDEDSQYRGRRSAVRDVRFRWTHNRIPYKIDDTFSAEEKLTIKSSMEHWMLGTCLLFVPASPQEYSYIKFAKKNRCYSLVGMIQDEQLIGLTESCAKQRHLVIHEIGHAIGLYHEQSRFDRDAYVDILEQNIRNETGDEIDNFDKLDWRWTSNFSTPYDYLSIMHYGKTYFTKDKEAGLVTISPKNMSYIDIIGEVTKISFWDAKMVNDMYECSAGCNEKQCPEGGFLGRRCECLCPGTDLEPVVRCNIPDQCQGKPADTDKYDHFTRQLNPLDESKNLFPDGTELLIANKEKFGCDYLQKDWIYTCRNGTWEGEVPPCVPVGCEIKDIWYLDFNVLAADEQYLNESHIRHGEKIQLQCFNNTNVVSNMTCNVRDWNETAVECPIGTCELLTLDHTAFQYILAEGDVLSGAENIRIDEENEETILLENAKVYNGTVITARCNYDLLGTNLTCVANEWDMLPPPCTERRECPLIENATVKGSYYAGYTIRCIEGYQMARKFTDRFDCTWEGNWSPLRPKCVPENCVILDGFSSLSLFDSEGVSLSRRSVVQHGEIVDVKCARSMISPYSSITCNFGKWSTVDGRLPTCKELICGPPPLENVQYRPRRDQYKYGSYVFALGCDNKADDFVGARNITCGTDGKWSGSAKCIPYCPNSKKSPFKKEKDKIIAAKESKIVPSVTERQCKRLCRSEKNFPCKAVVWGPSTDPKNAACKLHTQSFEFNQNSYMKRPLKHFHLFVRQC